MYLIWNKIKVKICAMTYLSTVFSQTVSKYLSSSLLLMHVKIVLQSSSIQYLIALTCFSFNFSSVHHLLILFRPCYLFLYTLIKAYTVGYLTLHSKEICLIVLPFIYDFIVKLRISFGTFVLVFFKYSKYFINLFI